jgi:ATP-dependent 26S proteasome regulatory subunit
MPQIKSNLKGEHVVKSIMIYGPTGAGKTLLVEAVANELGALLIHLTPDKLKGKFTGKQGPTKLAHMVFSIAMDPSMSPVVIYLDDCEQVCAVHA